MAGMFPLFYGKDDLKEEVFRLERQIHMYQMQITELKLDNKLKLEEKDFQMKHSTDKRVKELETENTDLKRKVAVLEERISMLDKIVDLNGDVIDVKKLVEQLISKLPEVKLNNLTVLNGHSNDK